MKALSTDSFELHLAHPIVHEVASADVECDDAQFGVMDLHALQTKLEAADDLAVLVLRSAFHSDEPLTGLTIDVNAEGLRMLDVGGTYLVPLSGKAPEGFERYALPSPLPADEHKVTWSFIWQPPKDRSSGAPLQGGVTLAPLAIRGRAVAPAGRMRAAPATVDLAAIETAGVQKMFQGVRLERHVELPLGATLLELEGPGRFDYEVELDGLALPRAGETTARFHLPPAIDGAHRLCLIAVRPARAITRLALH